jgi:hypothetical protein
MWTPRRGRARRLPAIDQVTLGRGPAPPTARPVTDDLAANGLVDFPLRRAARVDARTSGDTAGIAAGIEALARALEREDAATLAALAGVDIGRERRPRSRFMPSSDLPLMTRKSLTATPRRGR